MLGGSRHGNINSIIVKQKGREKTNEDLAG